jgi:DHA1 family tetracycline resistance protein-like MFS transporter
MPATQALVTKQVDRTVQGRVQGALSSLMSLAGILAPQFYTGIFAFFISTQGALHQPGAPFWAAGLLLVVALGMAWRFARAPQGVPQPA